jgi:hypothetical protein
MEFWPNEIVWTGENEKGWFRAPRTLPLILAFTRLEEGQRQHGPNPRVCRAVGAPHR